MSENEKKGLAKAKQTQTTEMILSDKPAVAMMQMIGSASKDPDIDADKMKALADMMYTHEDREAKKTFIKALIKCQKEMPLVVAASVNAHTKSTYAKLDKINKILVPIYTKNGFSFSFGSGETERPDYFRTTAIISHKDGHVREEFVDLPIDNKGANGNATKTEMHGVASSHKYGQRYLTCMVFNISTGDDDNDGNPPPEEQPLVSEEQAQRIWVFTQDNDIESNLNRILKTIGAAKIEELWASNYKNVMDQLKQAAIAKQNQQ